MASVEDLMTAITQAADLADEAWDLASQAKEKMQEARMALAAVGGQTPPELLERAISVLDVGYGDVENGQKACTASQELAREYMSRING